MSPLQNHGDRALEEMDFNDTVFVSDSRHQRWNEEQPPNGGAALDVREARLSRCTNVKGFVVLVATGFKTNMHNSRTLDVMEPWAIIYPEHLYNHGEGKIS